MGNKRLDNGLLAIVRSKSADQADAALDRCCERCNQQSCAGCPFKKAHAVAVRLLSDGPCGRSAAEIFAGAI